uniref:Uncharacterized protein n=1 Tax=Oryza glumipatula TaxID=40148 RepID=A0A0D9Y539_9ORYZ
MSSRAQELLDLFATSSKTARCEVAADILGWADFSTTVSSSDKGGSAETGNVGEARRPEPGGETRERDKKGGERVAEPSGMPETRRWLHSELSHSLGVRSDEREPCP